MAAVDPGRSGRRPGDGPRSDGPARRRHRSSCSSGSNSPTPGAVPRRAHRRARPAERDGPVGSDRRTGARRHPAAHHPAPRRNRPPGHKVAVIDAGGSSPTARPHELKTRVGATFVVVKLALPSEVAAAARHWLAAPTGARFDADTGRGAVPVTGGGPRPAASVRLLDAAGIRITDWPCGGQPRRRLPRPDGRHRPPGDGGDGAVDAGNGARAESAWWVVSDAAVMASAQPSPLRPGCRGWSCSRSSRPSCSSSAYVFGGAIAVPGVRYVDYLMGRTWYRQSHSAPPKRVSGWPRTYPRGMVDRFRTAHTVTPRLRDLLTTRPVVAVALTASGCPRHRAPGGSPELASVAAGRRGGLRRTADQPSTRSPGWPRADLRRHRCGQPNRWRPVRPPGER